MTADAPRFSGLTWGRSLVAVALPVALAVGTASWTLHAEIQSLRDDVIDRLARIEEGQKAATTERERHAGQIDKISERVRVLELRDAARRR